MASDHRAGGGHPPGGDVLRVLFVNHTSRISGGEHSLLALLGSLSENLEATVACPPGPLAEEAGRLGVPVVRVPGTAGSLKLHPWHTLRALAELGAEALAVARLARRTRAELVHANSIRAGLAASLAPLGSVPAVVHVRDCLPPGAAATLSLRAIDRRAALVLANSHYTEGCFRQVGSRARTEVLYSPVELDRFDPGIVSHSEARARLSLPAEAPVLAVIAQLTPWKGQDDAVRVVARLRDRFPKVRLLLIGTTKFVGDATRFDNLAYVRDLEEQIATLGLQGRVSFLGERSDVPAVLRAVDILLIPSWHEPFGRTAIEAMAMGVPVMATNEGGPAESVRDGVDGLLLPPRAPERWAQATAELLDDPGRRAQMGASGRDRAAERFSTAVVGAELLAHYRELLVEPG